MKKSVNIYFFIKVFGFVLFFILLFNPGYSLNDNLVSNVDGKIRVIILHNGGGYSGFWFDQKVVFKELLEKMDKDVGFVILLGKDYKADIVKEALKRYEAEKLPDGTSRVKYLTVDVKTSDFYPWGRDGYFIQTDGNNNLIFQDAGFNTKPFPIVNFDTIFENAKTRAAIIHRGGGNIRTTKEEIFIGIDTILGINVTSRWSRSYIGYETLYSMAKETKVEDLAVFIKKFNAHADLIHRILAPERKMIIPGKERFFSALKAGKFKFTKKRVRHTGAQASYHTDVYLGLGQINKEGKRIIFISDCNLGATIVKKISPKRRRQVERMLPEVLVGEGFTASGIPVTKEQIAERFSWEKHKLLDLCLKKVPIITKVLDETAKHLKKMGYHIVRIPYLPNGLDNRDDRNDGFRGISFNYSNVLTEVFDHTKRVYMPRFGFKELDDAAAKAYEEAGFKVIFIKGLLTNALTSREDGAGLDCLTSEIRFPVRWAKKYKSVKNK